MLCTFATILWTIMFIPWLICKFKQLIDDLLPPIEYKEQVPKFEKFQTNEKNIWLICEKCGECFADDFFGKIKKRCVYCRGTYIMTCEVKFTEVEIKKNKLN